MVRQWIVPVSDYPFRRLRAPGRRTRLPLRAATTRDVRLDRKADRSGRCRDRAGVAMRSFGVVLSGEKPPGAFDTSIRETWRRSDAVIRSDRRPAAQGHGAVVDRSDLPRDLDRRVPAAPE